MHKSSDRPLGRSQGSLRLKEKNMAGLKFDDAFPRVIDSRTHSAIDWVHSAANFIAAGIFAARGNKKAAAGAAILGANVLFNTLMTDYEYGVFRVWNFKVHGILDYSVAA